MQDDVARQRIESRRWQRVPNSEVRHVWQSDCDEDCESHGDTATPPEATKEPSGTNFESRGKQGDFKQD